MPLSNSGYLSDRDIAIIVLTWNGLEFTKRCLDSLDIPSLPQNVQVIVVDNGSTDGTLEYLRALDSVIIIDNGENLGYGKAVNIGIRAAKADSDIVLLNNDVELIEPDWLVKLTVCAKQEPKLGVIGVKILKSDGTLQHCGAYLPLDTWWGQQLAGGEVDVGQYSGVQRCESVVFACVYIKRQVFDEIGYLDERFFAYFEDTDFCLRAARAGFDIAIDGDIRVSHTESSSTKVNKVSHSDIFLASQSAFKKKWQDDLEARRYSKGRLDLHSIINFPSGYASSARSFVETMDKDNVRVAYQYVYGPGTVFPVVEPSHSDSYIVNMVRDRKFGTAQAQVVYAQGDVFERNTGHYKIGYTMLEVDGLPTEWVRQANMMDEIWVPSAFNKETFLNSGIKTPIHIIPLGVDPNYFSTKIQGKKLENVFSFLSIFEWGERKAPEVLLKAFSDEFDATENVVLVCKANNFDPSVDVKAAITALNLRRGGGRIRIAQNHILQRYELGVLYRSADCFVLPTRGEGWGMPILEAMACGLPVIATNWSSQTDFMTADNSLKLDVEKLVPAVAKCPYYDGFQWAQPSYEHLRQLMRWVFENQSKAQEIGQRAAADAHQLWTWSHAVEKIVARLDVIGQQ